MRDHVIPIRVPFTTGLVVVHLDGRSVKDIYEAAHARLSENPGLWKQGIMGEYSDRENKVLAHCCAGYLITHTVLNKQRVIDNGLVEFILQPMVALIPESYQRHKTVGDSVKVDAEKTVANWNDYEGRTVEEVIQLLHDVVVAEVANPTEIPARHLSTIDVTKTAEILVVDPALPDESRIDVV